MIAGHLDPDLRPTRSIQSLPTMSKRLQVSLVPEADGRVLSIGVTAKEDGSLQLRQVLGTLWRLSVDQVHLVGLPAYHAMTDRGDSIFLTAVYARFRGDGN